MMSTVTTNETRPRLWLRILKFLLLGLLVLLILALLVEAFMRWRDTRALPMPGQLIDIGSHQMHLWCEGSGAPTVVMDAGAIAFSTSWRSLMPLLAERTRVCAFDRSGLGWSEPGPGPWDGNTAADEIALLLGAAGEDEPVIYVGHSLGAMLGRIFAERHRERLAGLLLIEPADPAIIIAEFNDEREKPLNRDLPEPGCGTRCPMMMFAAASGIPRWLLHSQNILADPQLPELAVKEFVSRSVRPGNLSHLAVMGKYFPRIFFQTADNRSLGDIPVIFGYGTRSGELLGDHSSEEEWREDSEAQYRAWQKTGQTSTRFLGMRKVEDANHLSIVAYAKHAQTIAAMVYELVDLARSDSRGPGQQ